MATSSRTPHWAPAIALAAVLLLPAPALAGSAHVETEPLSGNPTVVFQGGGEVNTVSVTRSLPGGLDEIDYTFTDSNPISPGAGCTAVSSTQVKCVIHGRSESFGHILLGGGDDVTNVGFEQIGLDGQAGNDTVTGRSVSGGPGDDTVNGTSVSDVFFVSPGDGTDTINGGAGDVDTLRSTTSTLDLRGSPDTFNSVEVLQGNNVNADSEIFAGDQVVNTTTGAGWNVIGGNGDDHLVAGAAPTTLGGGNGDDTLDGGSAGDNINGGDGDDLIDGGAGDDQLDGGDGRDTIDGGDGADTFQGGDGEDLLLSQDGVVDTLRCGSGTDRTIADETDTIDPDCELSGPDTDGDGLKDEWEEHGFDADGDGTPEVDLPAMGAKVNHKDVFVEFDFMPPHKFNQAAIDKVVAAFAAAPVPNPDGHTGITLHVDNGPASTMNPVTGAKWGSRSKQSSVPHQAQTGTGSGSNYNWSAVDAIKAANFDPARAPIFHYALSAHAHDGTFSGISRGIEGSDFLVTLGAGCQALRGTDCTLDTTQQAGTFMHELGHNLGLQHGGGDGDNFKPTYVSIMNYLYQLVGLVHTNRSITFDYSRFSLGIDETTLDERTGFGVTSSSPAAPFVTQWTCPGGAASPVRPFVGSQDFDCSGSIDTTPVAVDLNNDSDQFGLAGHDDWPALTYAGGALGGEGRSLPVFTEESEDVPLDVLVAREKPLADFAAATPPPPGGGPGPTPPAGGGGSPATPGRPTPAAVRLTKLRIKRAAHHRFVVTYRLSRAATVAFKLQRRTGGRFKTVHGGFKHAGKAGRNRVRFSGKRLKKGRYRLVARPRGGSPARVKFAVRT